MARVEVTMPKMGESITEGTVVEWSKKIGDSVEQDETLLEIATDKVDSEVPAPEAGVLIEILVEEGDTIEVGEPIAIIETDPDAAAKALDKDGQKSKGASATEAGDKKAGKTEQDESESETSHSETSASRTADSEASDSEKSSDEPASGTENGKANAGESVEDRKDTDQPSKKEDSASAGNGYRQTGELAEVSRSSAEPDQTRPYPSDDAPAKKGDSSPQRKGSDGRFYSPLVRSIAEEEGISQEELESLEGSGNQGRVTKKDVLDYIEAGRPSSVRKQTTEKTESKKTEKQADRESGIQAGEMSPHRPKENVEIIQMDRMRKVISEHMIRSKQTSAHVTTFGEADVTRLVQFREKNKDRFYREHGFKLTFTPFFIEATIQALREYPLLNSSLDGDKILLKRDINYGIAVALGEAGTGGLIVPVIKNAGEMNVQGLARVTHELALKTRNKQLLPDDLADGTFTLTNYGSVGNLMGTPIINQPQVAIFGTGIIQKRPVVIEVEGSDTIAIRHMVYLSMSYDHRIIDGAMGGAFVQRVKQLLENFDVNRSI